MDRGNVIVIVALAFAFVGLPALAATCGEELKQKAAVDARRHELEMLRLQLAASARPCASARGGAVKKLLRLLDSDAGPPALFFFGGGTLLLSFCALFVLADACDAAAKRHHEIELKRLERAAPAASQGAP